MHWWNIFYFMEVRVWPLDFPSLTKIYLISRNLETFERGFINCLTVKCTSCILYFPKFKAVKLSFPKWLKFFGSYFHEVEIVKKHFHFQNGLKFPRLAKTFGNISQTSEAKYVTVMPVVSNKWNIWGWLFRWNGNYLKNILHCHEVEKYIDFCCFLSKTRDD